MVEIPETLRAAGGVEESFIGDRGRGEAPGKRFVRGNGLSFVFDVLRADVADPKEHLRRSRIIRVGLDERFILLDGRSEIRLFLRIARQAYARAPPQDVRRISR